MMVAVNDGTGLQYLLTDHLGSTVAVTNSSGTLTSQQRYLLFGAARTIPNSPILGTDFTYTGQRKLDDGMGGIMDYKARFYSPALMRFIQPDTIIPDQSNPQSWNRFSYVLGNPIRFNDPTGHRCANGDEDLWGYCNYTPPSESGGRGGNNDSVRRNKDCPLHQAFCIGWNWLTEEGEAGSSYDNPVILDESDEMVQDLMESQGVQQALLNYHLHGKTEIWYGQEVHFSDYFDGFIFADTWTETFLGGHVIHVVNNGDSTATLTVRNTSGFASLTHNPESDYTNPSVQTIVRNIINGNVQEAFEYIPPRLPTSVADLMSEYSPSSIFDNTYRGDGSGFGGNYYQLYTWTVPFP